MFTRLHFGGWGFFFRILNCEGRTKILNPPHLSNKPGLNNYLGLAQNFSQTYLQTYMWWAFLKNTTTYDWAQPQTALFEAAWI